MVGLLSRLAGRLVGQHDEEGSQDAHPPKVAVPAVPDPQNKDGSSSPSAAAAGPVDGENSRDGAGREVNGIQEQMLQFMPVEHPVEPPDNDHPVRCPAPEPCIVHDGKILKDRIAARRANRPTRGKSQPPPLVRRAVSLTDEAPLVFPSLSAPEDSILESLDD